MAPKAKLTLTPAEAESLLAVLRMGLADSAAFPTAADRRVRLERWVERLDERVPREIDLDVRAARADWDVFDACLGPVLKAHRATANAHFERLQAGTGDLAAARRDLAELECFESLARILSQIGAEHFAGQARRRPILP